ncbi:MAG TPA: DUF2339 domain-containing protein [Luteolibacter sp.]|nr:DUF2339 domain-containing protein [Luteolibacter sp.]
MEALITILILIGAGILIVAVIALIQAVKAAEDVKQLRKRFEELERRGLPRSEAAEPQWTDAKRETLSALREVIEARQIAPEIRHAPATPPPLPKPAPAPPPAQEVQLPQVEETPAAPKEVEVRKPTKPAFSLEHFMGVKLFAWLGGIAMFFGVIFFVKYAFDRNWISPAIRIALGFTTGAGLLVGGLWSHRKVDYRILAHALIATGILVLYGVTFAAYALYDFELFNQPVSFLLMSLITVAAFLISIRLNTQVVAALGMLGGFASPILLSTGVDHPIGLFSYIALLDIGILATTRIRNWRHLPTAAALGTILMQIGWFAKFFRAGVYTEGTATLIPMGILLFFTTLYAFAAWEAKRRRSDESNLSDSALALALVAMCGGFYFLMHAGIAQRPFLLYGFILLLNLITLAISTFERRFALAHLGAAILTFIHLAIWNEEHLKQESMISGLAIYLIFGCLHTCYPLIRKRFAAEEPHRLSQQASPWLAPATLLLMFLTVQAHHQAPLLLWVAVLIIDALVIGLAYRTRRAAPIIGALALTFLIAWAWLDNLPAVTQSITPLLAVIVAFGGLFATTGIWWIRMAAGTLLPKDPSAKIDFSQPELLTALSAVLPYGMLVLVLHKLPLANPSPVFGVALLLGILLLGLALIARRPLLVPVAAVCALAVEHAWFTERFDAAHPWTTFAWYVGFHALFTAFPLVFRKACAKQVMPWAAVALSGIGHFMLVHLLVRQSFTSTMGDCMGAVPLAFAVPSLLALWALRDGFQTMDATRQRQLAWTGGVTLLFITLIFPIQFSRQWITVSWALEGAALIWLLRKVPHSGLKWTALALLATAFFRLTFNPAVFNAYPRSGTAILNWHLYTYGIVIAASMLAARLLPPAHRHHGKLDLGGLLHGASAILLFLLLNIEIADFFTPKGERFIAFQFGGNFARDMTYSIAWGIFSLGLLGIGIWKRERIPRYAAIGLLAVTLLKVFFHDLSQIGSIYRIGALMGIAVIAFIASFLYQRFYSQTRDNAPHPD